MLRIAVFFPIAFHVFLVGQNGYVDEDRDRHAYLIIWFICTHTAFVVFENLKQDPMSLWGVYIYIYIYTVIYMPMDIHIFGNQSPAAFLLPTHFLSRRLRMLFFLRKHLLLSS